MRQEKSRIQLTDDKFQDIYKSEKFRNEIAYAHGYAERSGTVLYKMTCSYPVTYTHISEEQIKEAKTLIDKIAIEVLKENKEKLLFVGMGMNYEPRYKDDVCNHRIRTEFKNAQGKTYFIEVGTGKGDSMRIDFSIDRDKQEELNDSHDRQGEFYNYRGLEYRKDSVKFTLKNVLNLVNREFNCNFKEIVIDYYNISCDGVLCESPKK